MLYFKYNNSKSIYPNSFYSLEQSKQDSIILFLTGIMYSCYVKGVPFKVIDVVGKSNFKNGWGNTPLIEIYNRNVELNRDNAVRQSGIDVGNLFKNLLATSDLPFSVEKDHTNLYTPIKNPITK